MKRLIASIPFAAALVFSTGSALSQNKPAPQAAPSEPHVSEVKEHVKEPLTLGGGEAVMTGTVVFGYWDGKKGGGQPPLGAGTGHRYDHRHVSFGHKFSAPPRVMVAMSGLDAGGETTSIRVETYVTAVDETGFDVKVATWENSRVYGLHVNWIAVGK
jgi:H-type lectin domain